MCKVLTCSHGNVVYSSTPAACGAQLQEWIQWCSTPSSSSIVFLMEYYPATTAMAMPSPYVMPQPVEGAYMTASPYMAYDGYAASPYMPAMPAMPMSGLDGLDHSQGKWFAPGEALPPGFVITAHPEGHTAPQESHAMTDLARESFVIPASSAAAAVKTASAKSKKRSLDKKTTSVMFFWLWRTPLKAKHSVFLVHSRTTNVFSDFF